MSIFLFCFIVYIAIGMGLIPFFTGAAYKQILESKNVEHPHAPKNNEISARRECAITGSRRALTWPISLPLQLSINKIAKEVEANNKAELERLETERILKEYEDNDPTVKAFRELERQEAERKELEQKKKDESVLMKQLRELNEKVDQLPKQLNLPTSIQREYAAGGLTNQHYTGFYEDDEIVEVKNFDGSIAARYNTSRSLTPISKAEADAIIAQAKRDIVMVENNIKNAKKKVLAHQISVKHYEIILYQHIDTLNRITARMNEVRARIENAKNYH